MNDTLSMKIWRVIYPPIIYLAVNILVQFIAYFFIIITQFYQLKTDNSILSIGHSVEFINNIENILYQYANLITLISALLSLFIFYRIFKRSRKIEFTLNINKSYYYIAILGIFVSVGLSRLISLLPIDNLMGSYDKVEEILYSGNVGIQILTIAIVVPFLEEIIFRGLVYNRLKEYTDRVLAGVLSALMFGIYHMNLIQGLYAFFIGLILVYVYEKYKNIQAPILLHMTANAFALFLTYTKIDEFFSKYIIVYILVMLIELTASVAVLRLIQKRIS